MKMLSVVLVQDGEASNTAMMKAVNTRIVSGGIPSMSMTTVMPDLTHAMKRALRAVSNYYVMHKGELFCVAVTVICMYYDAVTQQPMISLGMPRRSVHRRDMQDVAVVKQTGLCHEIFRQAVVVVSTPLPSFWGYCKEHTPDMCNDPLTVVFGEGGSRVYYVNGTSTDSILYVVSSLKVPWKPTKLANQTNCRDIALSSGLLFVATAQGLSCLETQVGVIAPTAATLSEPRLSMVMVDLSINSPEDVNIEGKRYLVYMKLKFPTNSPPRLQPQHLLVEGCRKLMKKFKQSTTSTFSLLMVTVSHHSH